jgi:hypothetical protein
MESRWKTVERIGRASQRGAAFQWYGRRFGVGSGEDAVAVPVTTFTVGGTPRIVWRADLDSSLERLLDRLDGENEAEAEPPRRGRLS